MFIIISVQIKQLLIKKIDLKWYIICTILIIFFNYKIMYLLSTIARPRFRSDITPYLKDDTVLCLSSFLSIKSVSHASDRSK